MSTLEAYINQILPNSSQRYLWGLILLFFALRVYLMQRGTFEYSYKSAGEKVGLSIFTLIVLSYFFNIDGSTLSEDSKVFFQTIAVSAYILNAVFQSMNKDNLGLNTIFSLAKFVMLYLFSISDTPEKYAISVVFLMLSIVALRKKIVHQYEDKVTAAEVLISSASNIILTTVLFFWSTLDALLTPTVLIVFEETVMYVINLGVLEACKEYLDDNH